MKTKYNIIVVDAAAGCFKVAFSQAKTREYKVTGTITLEGNGGWDYLTVDKPPRGCSSHMVHALRSWI